MSAKSIISKSLIALSAAAVLGAGLAAPASAKTKVFLDVGFGVGGGYGGGYYPAYDDYYGWDDDCHYVKVKHHKTLKNGKVKVWFSKKLVCY